MTLRQKSIYYTLLSLVVLIVFIAVFQAYRNANSELFQILTVLDKFKHSSHKIQIEMTPVEGSEIDVDKALEVMTIIPDESQLLRDLSLSDEELEKLINVELSFIRIERTLRSYINNKELGAVSFQIRNEVQKIEKTVQSFINHTEGKIDQRKMMIERMIYLVYFVVTLSIIGGLFSLLNFFVKPVLLLSRQIEDIKNGNRENLDFQSGDDEIGRLAEFTRTTIDNLKSQSNELRLSKQELELHYHRQIALSQILQLSEESKGQDEFIEGALRILMTLSFLKEESKCCVFLAKGDPPELVLWKSVNLPPELSKTCARVPFGRCICGKTAASKERMYVDRVDQRHEIVYEGMTPHGHYCGPIISDDKLIGVLMIYLSHESSLQSIELSFLDDVVGILSDVLQRIKLEDRDRLISTAIEQAYEGIIITDINGEIQYANPAVQSITGYSFPELYGNSTRIFNSGSQQQEYYKEMWDTILSGRTWYGTLLNKRKSGYLYNEEMSITPVTDSSGNIINFVAIKKDITVEKQLEDHLLHAQKLDAIGTLAGGIAHDFNNLLTGVLGYAELMKSEIGQDSPFYKMLGIIEDSAVKGAALASRILNASKQEAAVSEVVSLNSVVEGSIELLSRTIPKLITIKQKLDPELPSIRGDSGQLQQLIINITLNAVDAMPDGGTLSISSYLAEEEFVLSNNLTDNKYIKLTISDTGMGIEKKIEKKVFDPFFTTKDGGEMGSGTGLGLYIVSTIVASHGGFINMNSEPGHGTTIRIFFPITKELPDSKEFPQDQSFTGTGTVLVIDDEQIIREILKVLLNKMGYTVIIASGAKEGIDIYRSNCKTIDIVFLDMMMPEMSGATVFNNLQAINPSVNTIIVSGFNREGYGDIQELIVKGAKAFVQKPFSRDKLIEAIKQIPSK